MITAVAKMLDRGTQGNSIRAQGKSVPEVLITCIN